MSSRARYSSVVGLGTLKPLPRLLASLVLGVLATRFTGAFFSNLHLTLANALGWGPISMEMLIYAHAVEFAVSSVGAFAAAAVFGRYELGVAMLVFAIEAVLVDPLLQQRAWKS